ncbi:hypothetical protein EHV15_31740 [Paenibacillus oralis]|uniref:ATP-grasp domain-containing protein n=1 Tax=Paenibacillus oralis TaxID=2490856 RepID=A0A3P3U9G2_9BACL|nr:hypothetical protein [Paenibacillus oralis]RRJ66991.1 hypothetical protein EHV15_31740 [Paenibacillus oralis]
MSSSVHCGSFEAERYWREEELAALPALPDAGAMSVISALDEMLFVFCRSGDILLTRHGMNRAQYDYLHSLGYAFKVNLEPLTTNSGEGSEAQEGMNVFQLLEGLTLEDPAGALIPEGAALEPFAVLPGATRMVQRYRLLPDLPDEQTVRRVNTKVYSIAMRDRLSLPNVGIVVRSSEDLLEKGLELLGNGPFLIKDDYGVSGKGNQTVDSESILRRLAKYLESGRNKAKKIRFVLEPLLDRETDFSCQFCIDQAGTVTILSVQQLINNGFAFGESQSPYAALLERLNRERYFELMHRIGNELYADGYFGHVCVDSMLLRDGTLAPLVEINARKSMSLIKYGFDCYLGEADIRTCLIQAALLAREDACYPALLEQMEQAGILFAKETGEGVLPLTSGALNPPGMARSSGPRKGKLYAALAYHDEGHKKQLLDKLGPALQSTGFTMLR